MNDDDRQRCSGAEIYPPAPRVGFALCRFSASTIFRRPSSPPSARRPAAGIGVASLPKQWGLRAVNGWLHQLGAQAISGAPRTLVIPKNSPGGKSYPPRGEGNILPPPPLRGAPRHREKQVRRWQKKIVFFLRQLLTAGVLRRDWCAEMIRTGGVVSRGDV